jgi:hypothetical protein
MKFINDRKILFGSLGLMISMFGINVAGAIAQSSNGLTSQQRALIDSTGIKIVVPDYIPRGFQVYDVRVKCPECRGRNSPRGPGYSIIYRNNRDTCFAIEGFMGGIGDIGVGVTSFYRYKIPTQLFGNIDLVFQSNTNLRYGVRYSPSEEQKKSSQSYLGTDWGNNNLMPRAHYRLLGADFTRQSYYGYRRNQSKTICRNDITPLDAEKIMKSLNWLDPQITR